MAVVATLLVAVLREWLDPVLGDNAPFQIFFAAIILTAWYSGFSPALITVVLGGFLATYLFDESRGDFLTYTMRSRVSFAVYVIIGSYLAYLIDQLKRDIARRKKVEADLLASQELVQIHQAELAHAGRLNLVGEMSASLAHELNQPLHSARNYAQGCIRRLQKYPESDPEVLAALERISEASDRAAEILRRVRDFVHKSPPRVAAVVLGEVLQDAVTIANMGSSLQRAKVIFEVAANLPPVQGDKVEIEQVVVNLARNGLESMDGLTTEERVLHVGACRCDRDMVEVFVRDSGTGILSDAMARLFEPFFSTKPKGMGMGLAICRSIVGRHEGRLWVTANEGRGCTFHFTLPVMES